MLNDRNVARLYLLFLLQIVKKNHLLIKRYYKNISRNRKENNYINYKCDIMNK